MEVRTVSLLVFFAVSILFPNVMVARSFEPPLPMVVRAPVSNVRSQPVPHSGRYEHDPLQQTQLEQGEPVLVYKKEGRWAWVECPEQLEFTQFQNWKGYMGWVNYQDLSSDRRSMHHLQRLDLPVPDLRKRLLDEARRHIGDPYLWGGRSKHDPKIKTAATGVDCSGLINWSFRQLGWFVPRDAHELNMRARPLKPSEMMPGDLIFLAKKDDPQKMVHVALYAGGDMLIESPETGQKVREISFKDRFGFFLKELEPGMLIGERILTFGTLFPE